MSKLRFLAPARALALAAIGMACTVGAAVPASAAPLQAASAGKICLTNARSNCISIGSAGNAWLGHDSIIRLPVGNDASGHSEVQIEDSTGTTCLLDTGQRGGVNAIWGVCGANGTVWILVPHTNGAYVQSRFAANHGTLLVLTSNTASQGAQLFVAPEAEPGGPWQTFTFFSS